MHFACSPSVNKFPDDEPFNVLGDVEEFLGIEKYLVKEKFITNEKTGFFCFDRGPDSEPACLSDQKVCS